MRSKPLIAFLVLGILGGLYALYRGFPAPDQRVEVAVKAPPAPEKIPVPPAPSPAAPPVPTDPSEAASLQKMAVLQDVINSHNDNDPRLDSELRSLSPRLREKLREYYASLAPEQLNARGTVAFLIGRDFQSAADADFLKIVISDEPCLSVGACNAKPDGRGVDPDVSNDVSLAYPQIVASRYLAKNWDKIEDPERRKAIKAALIQKASSPNTALANAAIKALAEIKH